MKAFIAFAVVFCLLPCLTAQLTGSWSPKDLEEIQTKCRDILVSSRSSRDLYYALQFLGSYAPNENFCNCDRITKSSQADVVYTLRAADYCKCDFHPSSDAIRSVSSNLQSNTVPILADGLVAAHYLSKQIAAKDTSQALHTLLTQLFSEDNKPLPVAYTHQVLEVLSLYKSDEDVNGRIRDILDSASEFLPNNNEDSLTDGSILSLLSALSDKKIRMQPSSLQALSEQLVGMKDASDIEKVYYAYASAKVVVSSYKGGGHYHLYPNPTTLVLPSPAVVHIHAVDVLGGRREVEGVEVVHIKGVGKDGGLFGGGVTLSGNEGVDLLSLNGGDKLAPGRYLVSLKVTVEGRTLALQTYVLVSEGGVGVGEVKVGVGKTASDLTVLSSPKSFYGVVTIEDGETLWVSYSVTKTSASGLAVTKKPHQTFVRITHTTTGNSVYYLSKLADAGEYATAVTFEDAERYAYTSGVYSVQIIVGDATLPSPLTFEVGEVTLSFPPRPAQNHALYAKSLLHASDVTLAPLPDIAHVMRPPAKRASTFIATLFTVLTALPLVLMVVSLLGVVSSKVAGGGSKGDSKFGGVWGLLYLVTMVAILLLYVAYWFGVTGFSFTDSIYYMCILIPLHMLGGMYALGGAAGKKAKAVGEDGDKTKKE